MILCEDREQERFLRRLCAQYAHISRVIRVEIAPPGQGSGAQWVVNRFPREVQFYRSQSNHLTNGLLIGIDGDNVGVEARKRQLQDELQGTGQQGRSESERIAVTVPTWSIETWLLWLCGTRVDEGTSYKGTAVYRHACESGRVTAARAAAAWRADPSSHEPPSLTDGRQEIARIEARHR